MVRPPDQMAWQTARQAGGECGEAARFKVAHERETLQVDPPLDREQPCECGGGIHLRLRCEHRQPRAMPAPAFRGKRVEHQTPGDDPPRAVIAQHDSVAMQGSGRSVQHDMDEPGFPAFQIAALQYPHPAGDRGGAEMRVDAGAVAELAPVRDANPRIQPVRRRVQPGIDQPIAAAQRRFLDPRAGNGQRAAVSGPRDFRRTILHMDATHPRGQPGRAQQQRVVQTDRAGGHRAGNDQPHARQGKTTIYGKPEARTEFVVFRACARRRRLLFQPCPQFRHALTGDAGYSQDRCGGIAVAGEQ